MDAITYSAARANLASTMDRVCNDHEALIITRSGESASSWNRCDPYEIWSVAKAKCNDPSVERISMQYNHSINGGPFYRMVDEPSICNLTYQPFSHNDWIKIPPEAPIVGYPLQNEYQY